MNEGVIFDRSVILENILSSKLKIEKISYKHQFYHQKVEILQQVNKVVDNEHRFELDLLARFSGFFSYFIKNHKHQIDDNFKFLGSHIKYLAFNKSEYLSSYYYLDIGKRNRKIILDKIQDIELSSSSLIFEQMKNLNVLNIRKIHVPNTSFLVGCLFGYRYQNGNKGIVDYISELVNSYYDIYMKYKTREIKSLPLFEGWEE